ncbi:cobalt-precorrin-6A synthase (deacetylating) [Desulfovibrio sp. X2]|uniref:cobalt-precorrin-5B (C(1))-methyltransferase CbiD n=1 Tax=Desulfovibrio sp. X2 TaxID=941449 RepID=UPI0003589010|nr:cobalt-precorrin-5B (C(1))-methyltransferase CbiD [Desulfovibrio sp. X2]EPR42117.1 cobalt-precorrin-6A synthase (deacetylating) [Desulfovibrio sp. X2]
MSRKGQALREGFTTGTAAAAAAKAATLALLGLLRPGAREPGDAADTPLLVDTPLPTGARLDVPVERATREGWGEDEAVRGLVIKDGGDDPDATHMARIEALVRLSDVPGVSVDGGRGVGRATLPGLPVAVGEAAINPAPRGQIAAAVAEALAQAQGAAGADVLIEVPEGERIAEKTMNARLGILGGISILGTRGTVRPFSHEAWTASVAQAMDVAKALGATTIALCTGGRSERFLRENLPALGLPDMPEHSIVQAADFFAFACREAASRGFARMVWGVFFGKLVKQAQALPNTHAHSAALDLDFLARRARAAGVAEPLAAQLPACATARHALEILRPSPALPGLLHELCRLAARAAAGFAASPQTDAPYSPQSGFSVSPESGFSARDGRTMLARCVLLDYDGTRLNDASSEEDRP